MRISVVGDVFRMLSRGTKSFRRSYWARSTRLSALHGRLSEFFPRFSFFFTPSSGLGRLPRRRCPLLTSRLQTTFFTQPHSFSTLSPPRAEHLPGNSARFLTTFHFHSSAQLPHNTLFVIHTHLSLLNNHGQMCVLFPPVHLVMVEMNAAGCLTFFLPLNSFALAPFATTLGLRSHPCALR